MPDPPGSGWRALVGVGRRSERSVYLLLAAVLVVVAFATVTAPRLLVEAEATSLERAIERSPAGARRLSIQLLGEFGRGDADDPLADQRARLDEVAAEIDDSLLDRYGAARIVADTTRFQVDGIKVVEAPTGQLAEPVPPVLPTLLTLRVHPELDEHSRVVAGRAAASTDVVVGGFRVMEIELSAATATELGLAVGDRILLGPDTSDLVTRQFSGALPDTFVAELVGVRELDDERDPYWSGDPRLHRPTIADTNAGAIVTAFGAIHPSQLRDRPFAVDASSPFALEQRRDLTVESVDLDTVDATLDGLVSLTATFAEQPTPARPGVVATLGDVLATEAAQRRAAHTTLVLAAVGVLGVVLTVLGQLLVVSFTRRRGWLTVARARGASRPQVACSAVVEMAVVAAGSIGVGWALALVAIGGERTAIEVALLGGLWAGAVAVAGAIAWSEGFRPVTVSARPTPHPGFGRWRRIGGLVLVIGAAGALVTFRRRGLATDSPDVDLLAVLVPVLVPLAAVHLTRWVLPAVLGRVTSRGLALGPGRLVGLRRLVAAPDAAVGTVTVLVLASTVAALGLGISQSLERGAIDASWVDVGAPYRLGVRDPAVADAVRAIPGAVVSASGSTRINLDRADSTYNVQFVTIDIAAITELTAGTAADASFPPSLVDLDPGAKVPVVAAERIGGDRVRVGDTFLGVGTREGQEFVVVETRPEAFGRRTDWMIVDRGVIAAGSGVEPAFNSLAVGVPDASRDRLEAIAAGADEELAVRTEVLDEQRTDPLSRAVRAGYLAAAVLAVALALLGLTAIAVVTARQRRREVAVLGLLGADRREISRAVASELVPAAIAGIVGGIAVGWLVVRTFDGRYDLSSFAGGSPVAVRPDLTGALAVAAVLAVLSVGLVVVLARRIVIAPIGEILRIDGAA